jgi:predicted nucleic acid-binding protein
MSDVVVDSSVVAKWLLPEADSAKAQRLITDAAATNERLIVLDLVFPEVANAIWKRSRQNLITQDEARQFLGALMRSPVVVEPASRLMTTAMDVALKYDRAIYDALFVALARHLGLKGVTADEPLFNVLRADFPEIVLLRDW